MLALAMSAPGATRGPNPNTAPQLNLRPVIGVFSQQTYRYLIPASYVNWIGQAGGRVLPILLGQSRDYYEQVFQQTNGLLFPGGQPGDRSRRHLYRGG